MITPNKVITLEDSALGLVSVILREGSAPINVMSLYHNVSDSFESIDQFLLALDVLYILGRVEVNFETGMVYYAI